MTLLSQYLQNNPLYQELRFGPSFELYEDVYTYKTDNKYIVELDLPGVKKENVDIQIENGNLRIKAIRKISTNKGEASRNVSRTLSLSKELDTDSISAKMEDGVLIISFDVAKKYANKKIAIE